VSCLNPRVKDERESSSPERLALYLARSLVRNLTKRARKDQESIYRDRDLRRAGKVVHSKAVGINCASIPDNPGVTQSSYTSLLTPSSRRPPPGNPFGSYTSCFPPGSRDLALLCATEPSRVAPLN